MKVLERDAVSVVSPTPLGAAENTDSAIRPFRVSIPDQELVELRRRIAASPWPTKELVKDRSQGVQLATLLELARYWTTEYDWRKLEARLNALPLIWAAPRSWVEAVYPGLAYFNEVDRGGHFAAWEEPALLAAELRAAFQAAAVMRRPAAGAKRQARVGRRNGHSGRS